jgi:hypothetical protein
MDAPTQHEIERWGLEADLSTVNAILAGMSENDDPIGYSQFLVRREEIERALRSMGSYRTDQACNRAPEDGRE